MKYYSRKVTFINTFLYKTGKTSLKEHKICNNIKHIICIWDTFDDFQLHLLS